MRICFVSAALALTFASAGAARAQSLLKPGLTAEATTDDRRRGLSWSDGTPSISATGFLPVTDRIEISAGVAALRGSARHGGADAGIDPAIRYRLDSGPWQMSAGVTGHIFAGGSGGLNYAEGDARIGYLIGPVGLAVAAAYAPRQSAIGGDNLYLSADTTIALPGTPWTVRGGIGRSSGDTRNPVRAARLRPDGRYWDYRLALEHVLGPLTAGARITATSIGDRDRTSPFDDRHSGTRVAGYLRFDL